MAYQHGTSFGAFILNEHSAYKVPGFAFGLYKEDLYSAVWTYEVYRRDMRVYGKSVIHDREYNDAVNIIRAVESLKSNIYIPTLRDVLDWQEYGDRGI